MKRARPNPRALCIEALCEVIDHRRYLDAALEQPLAQAGKDAALVQEMAYGTLRWYHQLDVVVDQLLDKPLKAKDLDVRLALMLGLYQLRFMRVAQHAAVDETVKAVTALGKPWAKGLINACLRSYLRERERADDAIEKNPSARFSHPRWLIDALKQDYPAAWEQILAANNERAPMTLRVNTRRQSRADYLQRLHAAGIGASAAEAADDAIVLETPVSVSTLPGFDAGDLSVQDAAAQLAAAYLDAQPGQRVLDACAAPGGKSAHLIEKTPDIELTALDVDAERVPLIKSNLERLRLAAHVRQADAAEPETWWNGQPFDRILVDAPCSATGVIRRHPDIKLRRQRDDLDKLTAAQERLLERLWPLLRPGGKLLYATCSVLAQENERQIAAFVSRHDDATEHLLTHPAAERRAHGLQILPGRQTMDGFFYACLIKR
jgi:16S rRNA (cytosine967-C5)-methyltransferase